MSHPASINRYSFRRLSPAEFNTALAESGLSIRDFMYLSGRHSHAVAKFQGKTDRDDQRPLMSDVLILELAKRRPDLIEVMFGIVNEYSADPQERNIA